MWNPSALAVSTYLQDSHGKSQSTPCGTDQEYAAAHQGHKAELGEWTPGLKNHLHQEQLKNHLKEKHTNTDLSEQVY